MWLNLGEMKEEWTVQLVKINRVLYLEEFRNFSDGCIFSEYFRKFPDGSMISDELSNSRRIKFTE